MKMRTICQDCNKVIKETECHHELWHWDSVGLCDECFKDEMKELEKQEIFTLNEAIAILDKYHKEGISDEDCAWEYIRTHYLKEVLTAYENPTKSKEIG